MVFKAMKLRKRREEILGLNLLNISKVKIRVEKDPTEKTEDWPFRYEGKTRE